MAAPRVSKVPIRRSYTDIDKWRVFNAYLSNGGYIKTAAKQCFISVSTVRSWIKAWDFDPENPLQARNPPQQPTEDEMAKVKDDGDTVSAYEDLRDMAIQRLREVIPKTNSADQLGRVIKDMADRIDRAKGIGMDLTTTGENNSRLAEAKALGEGLMDSLTRTLRSANERSEIIIEADTEPPREIEASKPADGSTDDA